MAGFLDDVMTMTFRGQSFAVRLQAGQDWNQWFPRQTIRTIDPILDSGDRYVDVGGVTYTPIQRAVAFNSVEDRDAFENMVGLDGVLTMFGRSRSALLADVEPIGSGTTAYAALNVTFEAV